MDLHHFEALIDLLQQEETIYQEMALLLSQERDALSALAVERLGEIVARKETLALRIKALDESRKVLARRLAQSLRFPENEITISLLCSQAPGPQAQRLRQIGDSLRRCVEHCKQLNDHNERAVARGMDLINDAIQYMIDSADPTGKVYQAPGAKGAYGGRAGHAARPGLISRQV